jgi:multiple sugar transport system substrate-binding protein
MIRHFRSSLFLKSLFAILLPGVWLAASGTGCSGGGSPVKPAAAPFQGETVAVIASAGLGFEQAWDINLHEWSARTGAEFRYREVDQGGAKNLSEALGSGQAGTAEGAASLVIFPVSRMAELTSTGALAKLSDAELAEDQLDWRDLFQGLRERIASTDAGPIALPLSTPVLVCYYRADLLQQAGLKPPRTWDDYQSLLENLETWAPGLTAVEPWSEATRATMFLARAVSYAHHPGHFSLFFDIETGAPLVGGPGFVRALEAAQKALAKMPRDVLGYDVPACRREILAGRAALAVAYETGPENPALPFEPRNPTKPEADSSRPQGLALGFCRLPGSPEIYNPTLQAWEPAPDEGAHQVTLTGFAGLAAGVLSQGSPASRQAAWNLLTSLTMDPSTASFPPGALSPCRESQLLQPDSWVGRDLGPSGSGRYLDAVGKSLRDRRQVAELPVIAREEFRQALTASLGHVLNGDSDPHAALTEAAQAWAKIAEQHGTEKVRDSYRRSLGLPARGESPRK